MLQVANLKIICTYSTEAFSKLRSAGLNHHLPILSIFSLTLTARGQVEQKGLIGDLGRGEAYFNCRDINGSALLSVTVHNQSFLNPYFSAKYGLILLKSFILK